MHSLDGYAMGCAFGSPNPSSEVHLVDPGLIDVDDPPFALHDAEIYDGPLLPHNQVLV